MQDIRKPYTRSRSSNDLLSRVEQFESARYRPSDIYRDEDPVQIPVGRRRRSLDAMDMYPRRRDDRDTYDRDDRYPDEDDHNDTPARRPKKKGSLGTLIFIVSIIALVTAVSLYTFVFNTATITIVPKHEDADLNKIFLFSLDGVDKNAIAYTLETATLSKTKTLTRSESRKVEAKASGKAVIYNNYDENPQKLIKNTRFESSSGKIYRINQSVEVPGKKGDTPGSIEVMLYADSNGSDYNIASSDFTIPGFKGTPRETAFYAKSKTPMTGGSSGTMSLVSLSDLNAAKDSIALELDKQMKDEMKSHTKEGYIPLYSAIEVTYEDNENEILSGITDEYKVTATGHLMLVPVDSFAASVAKTLGDYDGAPVRVSDTDSLSFTKKPSEKVTASGTLSILVEGKSRVIWQADEESIKNLVTGKDRDDFKPLMKSINSIESAEIDFSPLWLSRFPDTSSKIIINESLPKL